MAVLLVRKVLNILQDSLVFGYLVMILWHIYSLVHGERMLKISPNIFSLTMANG